MVDIVKTSRFYFIVLIEIIIVCSCENKSNMVINTRWPALVADVENIQKQLPRKMEDGIIWVRAEYEDSVYSIWVEVDEKQYSFTEMTNKIQERKKEILDDVSIAEGHDKYGYEMYVEHNVRMRLIYCGNKSKKQVEIVVTPSEINETLHTKIDAYKKLQALINSTNFIASENMNGMSQPVLTLKDSMVVMTIMLDETQHKIGEMSETEKEFAKTEIMTEMRMINPRLIKFMADANCSFCYRVIGSCTQKGFDIIISSHEIFFNKVILEADKKTKSEIVGL